MSVLISPEAYKKILQGDLNWLLRQHETKISKTINSNLRDFETKILREKASEFLLFLIIKEK